jgi:hypothetical protein
MNKLERFNEIREQMRQLADEALGMMPQGQPREFAKAYWYGHICCAIGGADNPFMSDDSTSMEKSLQALPDDSQEDDTWEDDEARNLCEAVRDE